MAGFLRFVTRSRYHAVGVSALSLLMPPFSFVAATIIGLATLRYGGGRGRRGACRLGGALRARDVGVRHVGRARGGVRGGDRPAGARALRAAPGHIVPEPRPRRGGLAAGASIIALYLLVADPVAWWTALVRDFLAARGDGVAVDPQSLDPLVELLAPMITGLPAAVVVTSMAAVFLARWGHAALDNPGGFGREFRELRLGRRFAAGAGLVAAVALFAAPRGAGPGQDLLMLLVAAYAIQGIALVHALVALRGGARGWLIAMYASLLLMPFTVLALSVAGSRTTGSTIEPGSAASDERARSRRACAVSARHDGRMRCHHGSDSSREGATTRQSRRQGVGQAGFARNYLIPKASR